MTIKKCIKQNFNKYSVNLATNGEYGLNYSLAVLYDSIILDIMLPIIDGYEIIF